MGIYYVHMKNKRRRTAIEIDGIPPCLFCGRSVVTISSNSGPLVCVTCDLGRNADGSAWTFAEMASRQDHYDCMLETYRRSTAEKQISRRIWVKPDQYGNMIIPCPIDNMDKDDLDKLFIELEIRLIQLETNGRNDIDYRRWFCGSWLKIINEEIVKRNHAT